MCRGMKKKITVRRKKLFINRARALYMSYNRCARDPANGAAPLARSVTGRADALISRAPATLSLLLRVVRRRYQLLLGGRRTSSTEKQ